MTEGIPGEITDWYHGGNALDLKKARIKVGDQEQSKFIEPNSKCTTFNFNLKSGVTNMQTFVIDAEGKEIGAYFVYVQKC